MSQMKKGVRGWLLIISIAIIASLAWEIFSSKPDAIPISNSNSAVDSGDNTTHLKKEDGSDFDNLTGLAANDSTNNSGQTDTNNNSTDQFLEEEFPVYIVGAINNPGIYKITSETCLYELVEQAGGLTGAAAGDRINLAAQLSKNQLIRIPTLEEWQQEPDKYQFNKNQVDLTNHDASVKLININTATASELEELPGIGPSTAKTIIDHRNKNGLFNSIEELMLVPGIKENRFASLRDLITI